MTHAQILITIIVITGLFGGIVNYFRLPQTEDSFSYYLFIKSIVIGIAASSLVPLFLEMISSDLLQTSKESKIDYFIIGGFCLVSGIFSNSFIDSIGKKVLNQLDNMKHEMINVKKEVDEATTEADNESATDLTSIDLGLSSNDVLILEAMIGSKYTYRSTTGLSKQLKLNKPTVKNGIDSLVEKGLVKLIRRDNGIRWRLTNDGVDYYNSKISN